ncbi:MAG TPA: FlgD immunoglobulin-like domain containing protein [Candidatus Krumholzibacteria bacterium]|nr:FlgD immunoglobulin-like domain containing protein [Candidatus Krumholzibacteria bacterium]
MSLRRYVPVLVVLVCALSTLSGSQRVLAVKPPVVASYVCHDDQWDPGEYCGRDAVTATGGWVTPGGPAATARPEMNHDCLVDGLDWALFLDEYGATGPGYSGDFNNDQYVGAMDFSFLGATTGYTVTPCSGVPVPEVCEGTISLSFSSSSVVNNASQSTGPQTAYVIMQNASQAVFVEYVLTASSNVTLDYTTSSALYSGGGPGWQFVRFAAPQGTGSVLVGEIHYTLLDTNPASISLGTLYNNWGKTRWTTIGAPESHSFDTRTNIGINGPTPAPGGCPGAQPVGSIEGQVYADYGNDCSFDSGTDYALAGRVVQATPGPYITTTDASGDYSFYLPTGQYTVQLAPGANDPWKLVSDCQTYERVINVTNNTVSTGVDFAMRPVGTLTGKVYADFGDDCSFDVGTDYYLAGRMVQASPGGYITFTDQAGNYSFSLPEGYYDVSWVPVANDPWSLSSCENPSYGVDVYENQNTVGPDIALHTAAYPQCYATVGIVSNGLHLGPPCPAGTAHMVTPCPGYEHEYLFTVKSEPTSTMPIPSGKTFSINLPSAFANAISSVTSDFPVTVDNTGPSNREVHLDAPMYPGQTCVIKVHATPASGGPYTSSDQLNDVCDGTLIASLTENDACSCDPNELSVKPQGCGQNGEIVGDEPMVYTILFENVGTGTAHNIRVESTLDNTNLDLSTLSIVGSSHTVTAWQIESDNVLVVNFDGIELPGTTGSGDRTGYVIFSIDPKPGLADGTAIQNTAQIFFDFNDPVATNTVLNTIESQPCAATAVGPKTGTPGATQLGQNHPNPFNPATTIEYQLASAQRVNITIYDAMGRLVRTLVDESKPAGWYSVEWNGRDQFGNPVASGVYMSRMKAGTVAQTRKLVLLK